MARHVHADLMVAYANDDSLELEVAGVRGGTVDWMPCKYPCWREGNTYRIKPKPPVVNVFYGVAAMLGGSTAEVKWLGPDNLMVENNIKLTFEDGKLLSAEVIK